MNDDSDYLQQFENCTLPKENFKHKGHLRITWLYLTHHTFNRAVVEIKEGIQRYAASLGASSIYHETLTLAWIHLVNQAMDHDSLCSEDFIAKNPHLLDKNLHLQYFSQALLDQDLARKQWVEPDLKPLDI